MPYDCLKPTGSYHGISDGRQPELTKKVQIVSIPDSIIYDINIIICLPDSDTIIVSYHRNCGIAIVNR